MPSSWIDSVRGTSISSLCEKGDAGLAYKKCSHSLGVYENENNGVFLFVSREQFDKMSDIHSTLKPVLYFEEAFAIDDKFHMSQIETQVMSSDDTPFRLNGLNGFWVTRELIIS